MARVYVLFLLLAGVYLPGYAQKKTISVIGSSTAAGYGLPDSDGNPVQNTWSNEDDDKPVNSWVNRLRRYYSGLNLLNELDNFAIFGEDIYQAQADTFQTPDSRQRPDPNNNTTKAVSVNPDIVLINFPSNGYDFFEVSETMSRFRDLYQQVTGNGHTVCYICTTQPRTSEGFADPNARLKLKILRDSIAAEFPSNYIDFYTSIVDDAPESSPGVPNDNYLGIKPQYAQGDGTHLNEAGHELLFNAVLAANIVPIANLPLSVGKIAVKRVDAQHITVTFTVYPDNTASQFFILVKDKEGHQKSVRVVIPDKTKTSQTITETIQIY